MRMTPQRHPRRRIVKKPQRTSRAGVSLRSKLALVFIPVMSIPVAILVMFILNQTSSVPDEIREIAIAGVAEALEDSAEENLAALSAAKTMYLEAFFR